MDKTQEMKAKLESYRATKASNPASGDLSVATSSIPSSGNIKADLEAYRASKNTTPTPLVPKSDAWFPSSPDDNGLTAGLKALGNTPQSAFNFAKGAVQSLNPITTAKTIGEIGTQFKEGSQEMGTGKLIKETIKGLPKAAYETLVPKGIRKLISGDLSGASKDFTEDPFGQVAPVALALEGGVKGMASREAIANKAAMSEYVKNISPETAGNIPKPKTTFQDINTAVDKTISKVGGKTADVIGNVVSKPFNFVGAITRSAASHLIGLDPTSIKQIISNPEEFSKIKQEQATRGGLASEFGNAIDNLETTLQDTGEHYNPIRADTTPVKIPKDLFESTLKEFGFKFNKGKVIADSNSLTRNPSDVKALQNFADNWAHKQVITANEYLNMRKDIAGIARFGKELGKNIDAQTVGTKLYENANKTVRPQINGLEALDAEYSPIKQQFNQIKKDFLQKGVDGEYTFKDGAINKIANATGKGKDALLARMEEIMPGITKRVQILKAAEDIQAAYGNKVGTYARGIIGGGSILTGNIAGIVATIISNPSIAVPLLRGLGYTAKTVAPIVNALKMIGGDINQGKLPMLRVKSIDAKSPKANTYPISDGLNPELPAKIAEQKPNENSNQGVFDNHINMIQQLEGNVKDVQVPKRVLKKPVKSNVKVKKLPKLIKTKK